MTTDTTTTRARGDAPKRKYASEPMQDRRRRILLEAQRMLDEDGVEGFTIRGLCRRANVAQGTLYNAFGSKEEIMAAAIELHFETLVEEADLPPPAEDLEGQLARLRLVNDVVISLKRYASAMTGVFFSRNVDPRIHASLMRIAHSSSGVWIDRATKTKILTKLDPWQQTALVALIANSSYANTNDWATGRLSDDEYRARTQMNFLTVIYRHLTPAFRQRADQLLSDLSVQAAPEAKLAS